MINMKVGDECVVNRLLDTPIYTIKAIDNRVADLTYTQGTKTVSGGSVPAASLMRPNKQQLDYNRSKGHHE